MEYAFHQYAAPHVVCGVSFEALPNDREAMREAERLLGWNELWSVEVCQDVREVGRVRRPLQAAASA